MKIKPNDWSDAFVRFAVKSYENFQTLPEEDLGARFKLLGQTTFKGVEVRTVIRKGNVLVEAIPLGGTTHDVVEEFVAQANPEFQGEGLPKANQERLIFAARQSILDATQDVIEALIPEYLEARTTIARYSQVRVVTSRDQVPEDAVAREHFPDIIKLANKIKAIRGKTPSLAIEQRFANSILHVHGTGATIYELPEGQNNQNTRRAA